MYYDEYDEHDAFEIVDGKPILKDGKAMSISVMLMDSALRDRVTFPTKTRPTPASPVKTFDAANHRPHAVALTDSDRERRQKLYAEYSKKLSEQWKNPAPTAATETVQLQQVRTPAPAPGGLDAAYARADERLRNRWKGGAA